MAVHAEQTRALYMGGTTRVQKIAAVYSWLQRKLSNCVAKAQARLLLERLKFVAPTNLPIMRQGEAAAMDLIVGQEADWQAAHDYRPPVGGWRADICTSRTDGWTVFLNVRSSLYSDTTCIVKLRSPPFTIQVVSLYRYLL